MKYSKFAFVPFALIGIFICLFLTTASYSNRLKKSIHEAKEKNRDFSTVHRKLTKFKLERIKLCGGTFLFALISSGLIFFSPTKEDKQPPSQIIATNRNTPKWWWQLYLATWLFVLFMSTILFFIPFPYLVEILIFDGTVLLFSFKGLILIPAFRKNNQLPEEEQSHHYVPLIILEALIICLSLLFIWFLVQLGEPIEGDWN